MSSILTVIKQSYQYHLKHQPALAKKIYIACSGGRDSMALLVACQQLQLPIHVIHINHKLQTASDDWQQFVETYCQTHAIDYDSVCIDWQARQILDANSDTVNEQQARTARYQAIIKIAGENAVIALAHHANDQAETLLMNLCQGTGLAGLTGMAAFGVQHEFGQPVWLWRPLLTVTREEISEFVEHHAIPYVDDPTNSGMDNQRAFLRNQILPLLDTRFNKVVQNLSRTQRNLAEAQRIVDEQYQNDLTLCQLPSGWTPYQQRLAITCLTSLDVARRFNLLHQWVKGSQKFAPSRQFIEQIEQLLQSQQQDQQAILQWQGIEIRKYRTTLYRLAPTYVSAIHTPDESAILVHVLPNFGLSLATRPVLPNEQFQLLPQPFHQSFKKICQRFDLPSWERQFAQVVIALENNHLDAVSREQARLALLLPSGSFWLAEACNLELPTNDACPWQLTLSI